MSSIDGKKEPLQNKLGDGFLSKWVGVASGVYAPPYISDAQTSSLIACPFSSWSLTKRSIMSISLLVVYFKYLWNPLRTAIEANVTLFTSADLRSVSSPGL